VRTFDETPEVRGMPDRVPLPFGYLPGQFLDLTITIDGKPGKRSYSIASSPTERDYIEISPNASRSALCPAIFTNT
jgi:glycine betaine catabolism B